MFDLVTLIKTVGYLGLFGIVFAESGLFIGFFLPGDSLLFTAGFLASQGFLNITLLTAGVFIAAVAGDNFGYAFGRRVGPALFTREDSLLFHKNHLERAQIFYERHGAKTIVLARFLPVIRTFAPILAGAGNMRYSIFFRYNVIGAFAWAVGVTLAGYFLGSVVPGVDRYLLPIILLIILISFLPSVIHVIRDKEDRARIAAFLRAVLGQKILRALEFAAGVLLLIIGFFATITPMTPGSWLMFIGLELLGLQVLFHRKLRRTWRWLKRRGDFSHDQETGDKKENQNE